MDYQLLKQFVNENKSIRDIAKYFVVGSTTIRYWLKKYNLKTNGFDRNNRWGKENLENAVISSKSKSEVLRTLGLPIKSGNFQTLDRYCLKYGLSVVYDGSKYDSSKSPQKYASNDDIFTENSPATNTQHVKKRALKNGFLVEKCYACGMGAIWNGFPLSLQLDHINGVRSDNRLTNIRLLCPNCHSQTSTFSGRNKKNKTMESGSIPSSTTYF